MKFLQTADTAIVIPVHGGLPLTMRCLASLRECDPLPVMVVVVDDGSPDDTAAHLATHDPDVHVVPGDGNLWWSGAVNVGCDYAIEFGARTLILLNNDDVELSANLLTELVRLVDEHGCCVGATALMEAPNGELTIFHSGGNIDWRRGGTELRHSGDAFQPADSNSECDWLPGMALAFPAEVFRAVDGIDARWFPQSRGDADFTLRASSSGYPSVISTTCWVINDRTQTPFGFNRRLSFADLFRGLIIRNSNYQLRTTLLFFVRHCPRRRFLPSLAGFYARYLYAWLKTQRLPRLVSNQAPPSAVRLAFVLWSGAIGGAETFAAALTPVLRQSGVDAQVVIIGHAEPLAERLRSAGVPFHELGLKRGRAALRHPRRVARVVEQAGADGAVLVSGGFLALALRIGGYHGRIAAVEHGSLLQSDQLHRQSAVHRRFDRLLGARAVDIHVAVSTFLHDHMPSGPRPTVTIPNGVDLDIYRPAPRAPDRNEFVIGCSSRLIPGKGVEDVLVAAVPALSRGARLRIAGDGPERTTLERQAEQLGIADRVDFEGWLPDVSEVVAFWHGCDVAITAPNDWVESFGLGAVEAMACGKPVVAVRAGALSETIVDGETGILVTPRDTDALAKALLSYLDDATLTARHAAAARAWCEKQFDIRRSAREYSALFGHHARTIVPGTNRVAAVPPS